jgi:hypothetical protein
MMATQTVICGDSLAYLRTLPPLRLGQKVQEITDAAE